MGTRDQIEMLKVAVTENSTADARTSAGQTKVFISSPARTLLQSPAEDQRDPMNGRV
jgi:hypothetical protein